METLNPCIHGLTINHFKNKPKHSFLSWPKLAVHPFHFFQQVQRGAFQTKTQILEKGKLHLADPEEPMLRINILQYKICRNL